MCTQLCIQVSSATQPQKLEVEFLFNEEWTSDAEVRLLQRLKEILEFVRPNGKGLKLNLDIDAIDPGEVMFHLKKKLHGATERFRPQKLSTREIEILALIMNGYTNQQVAEKLFISFETVRTHRKNILTKVGAKNTAALINYYHQTFFEK